MYRRPNEIIQIDILFHEMPEIYGPDLINAYQSLTKEEMKLMLFVIELINSHLVAYCEIWDNTPYAKKKSQIDKCLFDKSCLELIFLDLVIIYNQTCEKFPESEIYDLLDYIVLEKFKNETQIFSDGTDVNYDQIWENRFKIYATFILELTEDNKKNNSTLYHNYCTLLFYLLIENPLSIDSPKFEKNGIIDFHAMNIELIASQVTTKEPPLFVHLFIEKINEKVFAPLNALN